MTLTEVLPDEATLRSERRARVVAAMEEAGVDILISGRESNARYIAGVPRLWLAGSRPFGPGCVITRDPETVHLVNTWDEGVPEDIPHENLHGITFNSQNTLGWLTKVEGAATAKTVATDGLMPKTAKLISTAFPSATLVDGEQLMSWVRRTKLPAEIEGIRASVRIAEEALAAAEATFAAGRTERQLTAVFMEAMSAAAVTTPTTQDVAWITSRQSPWSRTSRDAAAAPDDLVVFAGGVCANGYTGEIGRTISVAGLEASAGPLLRQWDDLWERLLAACRPGATGTDLLEAYTPCPAPPMPVARGLGLGNDYPMVTHALPRTAAGQRLEAGMVIALTGFVWEVGRGAVLGTEPVLVTDSGPELLSHKPFRAL